ncbi:MAG TPA: hypothetical protein VFT29_15015 [Gemmatimonadaceae bacterium]|nr:hypothetical protein [Gemmatimonadaceae bacterium]
MHTRFEFAALAVALCAAPLAGQMIPRVPDSPVIILDPTTIPGSGTVLSQRGTSRVPPGHLPPRGMCRVWIDGVPPGQQPPVTDCATAQRNRVANSRVIYGSRESFPGRGRGKFDQRSNVDCTFRDAVVVSGRVIDVCRDANGRVIDRRDRDARQNRDVYGRVIDGRGVWRQDDQGDDDDDDRFDRSSRAFESDKVKHGKSKKHGKHGKHGDD